MDDPIHVPVLLDEVVAWLQPKPQGRYVDCTVGHGGTALRILELSKPVGWFIGIDQDPKALVFAKQLLKPYLSRAQFFCENFQYLKSIMMTAWMNNADGIFMDLGVSSSQLSDSSRGFSFQQDGPLDMCMNPGKGPTAEEIINSFPEAKLADIIFEYGEERYSRRIAKGIANARKHSPLLTTFQLSEVVQRSVPPAYRRGRLHPATRTFQAIRIAVNNELEVLTTAIQDAPELLAPGGRLCVISFHSLEDRLVKHRFRELSKDPNRGFSVLTKKPCVPTLEERKRNPRSRSAKLRVLERSKESEEPLGLKAR